MTLEEMRKQRKELDAQIAAKEKEELLNAQQAVIKKVEDIPEEERRILLKHLKHTCGSCKDDDDNPTNGWSHSRGYAACPKCALMEIFDGWHGGELDFQFEVSVHKVTV